jgi:carbon-monoxide dehydrogenase medium subunit
MGEIAVKLTVNGEVRPATVEPRLTLAEDLHGSARYRTRVGATLVARAWTKAVEEARRG